MGTFEDPSQPFEARLAYLWKSHFLNHDTDDICRDLLDGIANNLTTYTRAASLVEIKPHQARCSDFSSSGTCPSHCVWTGSNCEACIDISGKYKQSGSWASSGITELKQSGCAGTLRGTQRHTQSQGVPREPQSQ